ncbi:hypothetical protein IC006_2478 [Sulfuracidifex tepidarius]|uniref:Uncharacterized protein n=1 Tax=Sulfuracidifex tepidarius TaxID=1294262 RepID=A0A510DY41_9CREN|nr:hypothetical protein [Sulfuracidifex tepidarius]BBG25143.1 hypothetical protein IC006_2478 [Sulfuracidifex tepidarius]
MALSFLASTIAVIHYTSLELIEILLPILYVGALVVSSLIGLVFFPLVRKYYGRTEKGGMNFSFMLAGLYMIMSYAALGSYPNLYLTGLQFLVGIVLISMIVRTFLGLRETLKVVTITLVTYVGLNALIAIIKILYHGV